MRKLTVGDRVLIINMEEHPDYIGREGRVIRIDAEGKLYGSWGCDPINPRVDEFTRVSDYGSF